MSCSRYTLLIDSLIHWLKKNFRLYLKHVHLAFLTTLVVLVFFYVFFLSFFFYVFFLVFFLLCFFLVFFLLCFFSCLFYVFFLVFLFVFLFICFSFCLSVSLSFVQIFFKRWKAKFLKIDITRHLWSAVVLLLWIEHDLEEFPILLMNSSELSIQLHQLYFNQINRKGG